MPEYCISRHAYTFQGVLPLVTRKLLRSEEIKVPGNVTHVELNAEPGVHYGLQICGIYSEDRTKSPFNIVPVIPFMCQKCKKNGSSSLLND